MIYCYLCCCADSCRYHEVFVPRYSVDILIELYDDVVVVLLIGMLLAELKQGHMSYISLTSFLVSFLLGLHGQSASIK